MFVGAVLSPRKIWQTQIQHANFHLSIVFILYGKNAMEIFIPLLQSASFQDREDWLCHGSLQAARN
jgi:hypothetical protein